MFRFCLLVGVATALAQNAYNVDSRSVTFQGKPNPQIFGLGQIGSGFRDDSYEDNVVTPTPSPTPLHRQSQSQQPIYRKPTTPLRGGALNQQNTQQVAEELLEEEKDEPDRLSLLLPQSKFDCVGTPTGYYADEDLNCEVFHYCHDNAKHSWICPEGFTFHQVHLICMPPTGDVMCKKSSQYHFVNEYLYKPLNLQEAESKPNVTLRYSERYFPGDIFTDERESEEYPAPSNNLKRPTHQQNVFASPSVTTPNSLPTAARPSSQNLPQYRISSNQVFRSPEEVNIPLQQRRPQLQQQQILRRFPQVRPDEEEFE